MPVIALSAKKMKSLTCPDAMGKQNIHDAQCKGLVLELRSSGGRTWYFRYRDSYGRQHQLRLGSASDISLEQARQMTDQLRARVAMGEDPAEEKRTQRATPTLAEFVSTMYLPHAQSYKRSWDTDETLLRCHILPYLGQHRLDAITRGDLVEVFARHRATHKPGSTNRLIVLVRYLFNCALKWEVAGVTRNPSHGIELFPNPNVCERYLTTEESQRLLEALSHSQSSMLRYIIPMLLVTGARRNEVLHAKWDDFDFERRIWTIEKNKTGKPRHVPLSDAALQLLETVPRVEGSYVFANPKTGQPYVHLHGAWDWARKRARLPDLRIHDLRHSFASFLVNNGRSLYEVQRILGHTQVKTTQRYSHLSQDSLLSAANTVQSVVPLENWLLDQQPSKKVAANEDEAYTAGAVHETDVHETEESTA